ncbi:putative HTH-type transcriptional regulator YtcD [compost metagenome]
MQKKIKQTVTTPECKKGMLAINDALELLSGKWKIKIIALLLNHKKFLFMELLREIDGIGTKMLTKNLHELEVNQLITRTVLATKPVTVEYQLTPHGQTLISVIDAIESWGTSHRNFLLHQ